MKKALLGTALLLLLLFAGGAWAEDVIKVGYLAGITGDFAAYGQPEVNAVRLAADEINAAGGVLGKKIEVIVYDYKSRPEDAVNAARRLIDYDKVVAILGSASSGANIATAPLVSRAGIPQIGTLSTNPLVTVDEKGNVRPWMFRICFIDPYQGRLIGYFAAKELKKMKAAILYDVGSDYSQGLREYFMKSYKEFGGEVVADYGFRGGPDVDFRAQLTEIKESGAEILVLPNIGKDLALPIKQAAELGMDNMVFIGGDGYGEFLVEIAGKALEGSYWMYHLARQDPAMKPFFDAYKAKYNDDCQEFAIAVLGYDSLYWLVDAIRRAGSEDPKAIRDALEATTNLQLHHATLTMDPKTHNPVDKDAVVLTIKDGKSIFFKKIRPQ
ncbi:ABC transporter substrate-binding protein [Aminivibrio sp.]